MADDKYSSSAHQHNGATLNILNGAASTPAVLANASLLDQCNRGRIDPGQFSE